MPDAFEREPKLNEVMEFTGITPIADKQLKILSRGMQQRLTVGRELLHNPKVLLLDEPAAGMDPRARIELLEMLRTLAKAGTAVLLSSHILDELGDQHHSLTILELGKVMEHGALDKIRKRHASGQTVSVRVGEGVKALE